MRGHMDLFLEILRCILCCEEKSQDDSDIDDEIYQNEPLLKSLSSSSNRSLGWNYKVYQSSRYFSPSTNKEPLSTKITASSSGPSPFPSTPVLPTPITPQTFKTVQNVPASKATRKEGKTTLVVEKSPSGVKTRDKTTYIRQSPANLPSTSDKPPLSSPKSTPSSQSSSSSDDKVYQSSRYFSPSTSKEPLSTKITASSSGPSPFPSTPVLPTPIAPQTFKTVQNVPASKATRKEGKTTLVVEKSPSGVKTRDKTTYIRQSPANLPSTSDKPPLSSPKSTPSSQSSSSSDDKVYQSSRYFSPSTSKEPLSTKITASSSGPSPFPSTPVLPTPIAPQTFNTVQNVPASKATRKEGKTTLVVEKSPRGVKTRDKTTYIRQSPANLPSTSDKPPLSSPKTTPSSQSSSSSDDELPFHPVYKSVLRKAPSNGTETETKASYVWVENSTIYAIPREIKSLIEKDIAPEILKQPLSPLTYKDYFGALLYAEEFYLEKLSKFILKNVVLESEAAEVNKYLKQKKYKNERVKDKNKTFVVFETDSIPGTRPFLLSRDLVYARPSGSEFEPFQGIIHRVVKSTKVLVEFGDDFHRKHRPSCPYDISFSFNRVCLKRAHQAVEATSVPMFQNFLFPDCPFRGSILTPSVLSVDRKLEMDHLYVTQLILRIQRPPPYLVVGPPCATDEEISRTGILVRDTISKIYQTSRDCRILVCAPINKTCDVLTRSLQYDIPEYDLFRANAAFRDINDEVPVDILPSCLFERECFACPSLQELKQYRVIITTYMSSFRLHNAGITAGHFSHIFLLDASSATEPDTMVALINLADENTAVIVTGARGNRSGWVRSNIGRKHGLSKSYFERLSESKQYMTLDPMFIAQIDD